LTAEHAHFDVKFMQFGDRGLRVSRGASAMPMTPAATIHGGEHRGSSAVGEFVTACGYRS
jgi:hypothetical protein